MGRKTLRQRRDRDLKRYQLETFGLDEVENLNNRVGQLREKIEGLNDPQDIMLEIISIFNFLTSIISSFTATLGKTLKE